MIVSLRAHKLEPMAAPKEQTIPRSCDPEGRKDARTLFGGGGRGIHVIAPMTCSSACKKRI